MAFASDPVDIRVPGPEPQGTTRRTRGVENVARAYIEGLERDRRELFELQQQYDRLVWETIQISAYAKALYMGLYRLYYYSTEGGAPPWNQVEELLEADRRTYHDVWTCECGHHRWDHEEDGTCQYLACRHICGLPQKP